MLKRDLAAQPVPVAGVAAVCAGATPVGGAAVNAVTQSAALEVADRWLAERDGVNARVDAYVVRGFMLSEAQRIVCLADLGEAETVVRMLCDAFTPTVTDIDPTPPHGIPRLRLVDL